VRAIKIFAYAKELYRRYIADEVPAYGAEMAYYFILAVFPFLIFLVTIIGYFPISVDDILEPLGDFLPYQSYHVLRGNVEQVINTRSLRLMSFGFISMLWAASNGMGAMMRGINKALCEKDTRPFWIAVPLSILFTVLVTLLILFYFVLLIFGRQISRLLFPVELPRIYWQVWHILRYGVAVLMMVLVFVFVYRFSPCKKIRWRNAMPGAIFTTIGWLLVSLAFSFYVNQFWNLSLIYGSLGGIIALLVWLFISAQLIILGGEVNAILIFSRKNNQADKSKGNPPNEN
jgi:membrane protein